MAPESEQDQEAPFDDQDLQVQQPLETIDGSLLAGMPLDDRFESGVPDGQRADSLDFIQMTGLTRAPLRAPSPSPTPKENLANPDDLNPTAPLSFYEAGVADVDDGGQQGASGLADAVLDASLVTERPSDTLRAKKSNSAAAFKDIVAGLEMGATYSAGHEHSEEPAPVVPADAPVTQEPEWESRSASSDMLAMLDELETDTASDVTPAEAIVEDTPAVESLTTAQDAEGQDADSMTDDWDAYLDAVSPVPDSSPEEETPQAIPLRSKGNPLAEAEELMQALGQGKKVEEPDEAGETASASSLLPMYTPTAKPTDLETELAYDYSAIPSRRRSRRHSKTGRRGRGIIKLILLFGLLIGVIAAAYYYFLLPLMEQTEDLEAKAERLLSEGHYAEASRTYDKLARNPQGDAEASFQAAYALTLGPERSADEKNRRYRDALQRFSAFVEAHPEHPKYTRALTLMGRLHYELTEYDEAIAILKDRANPVDDPAAALTMWRYLARAYSMKADYQSARIAYLQAATLPGNYSADQDYIELGEMYNTRAELADSTVEKNDFTQEALVFWQKAIQVPGIEPTQKAALKERLDWLVYQTAESGLPMVVSTPNDTVTAEPLETMSSVNEIVAAPIEESLPEPVTDEGSYEEAPGAEFNTRLPAPEIAVPESASSEGFMEPKEPESETSYGEAPAAAE